MTSQKEVVIVVPGAKFLSDNNHLTRSIILFFYGIMHVLKPIYNNYAKEWGSKFERRNRKIIWLRWNRGFTIWSRWAGASILKKEVLKYHKKGYKIKIVGISLGGDIAIRVLNKLPENTIDRIIFICSTNTNKKISKPGTKIFNIYSPYDLFVVISTRILAPITGGILIEGPLVKNIAIEHFRHDEFCADEIIKTGKYKGKRITDLVKEFLNED
jgi:hypothetical protein